MNYFGPNSGCVSSLVGGRATLARKSCSQFRESVNYNNSQRENNSRKKPLYFKGCELCELCELFFINFCTEIVCSQFKTEVVFYIKLEKITHVIHNSHAACKRAGSDEGGMLNEI